MRTHGLSRSSPLRLAVVRAWKRSSAVYVFPFAARGRMLSLISSLLHLFVSNCVCGCPGNMYKSGELDKVLGHERPSTPQ
jgi:hypothetical protein